MHARRIRWATLIVLAGGTCLRLALAVVTPPELAYDDHFTPIRIVAREQRLPAANECWQCYQPPLYYVISAGVFETAERVAAAWGRTPADAQRIGHKALQFISVVAGSATLWMCVLVLRRACRPSAAHEALGVGVVALLPQHIYMSAMVTNDALTYLLATLTVYAALRAHDAGWPVLHAVVTGLLAGATVLSKAYGLVTALTVLLMIGGGAILSIVRRARLPGGEHPTVPSHALRPTPSAALALLVAASAFGVWPTVRNLGWYGRLHVDNFDFFRTPMRLQPPGAASAIDFTSFRLLDLLKYPWVHTTHVNSFWTELYARLWFDYEGLTVTLRAAREWRAHDARVSQIHPRWTRERWQALLNWNPRDVPPDFRRVAVMSYWAGLPLTLVPLAGLLLGLRRCGRDFGVALLLVHFVLCLAIPLFQALRIPYFAAMKTAFALSMVSSVPVLVVLAVQSLRAWAGRVLAMVLWLGLALLAAANVGFVAAQYRQLTPALGQPW